MKPSASTPTLAGSTQKTKPMIKSVSCNSLMTMDIASLNTMLVTQVPITQSVQCIIAEPFPDTILGRGTDADEKNMLACLLTPPELPQLMTRDDSYVGIRSILQGYFNAVVENKAVHERYHKWLQRVRRARQLDRDARTDRVIP